MNDEDLQGPLAFFRHENAQGGFDAGIEIALNAVLVNPQFLLRIERDPPEVTEATAYPDFPRSAEIRVGGKLIRRVFELTC